MVETLLSSSNLLLFGRKVEDIAIVPPVRLAPGPRVKVAVATTGPINIANNVPDPMDQIPIKNGIRILLKNQANPAENGVYKVVQKKISRVPKNWDTTVTISVKFGALNGGKSFDLAADGAISENNGVADDRHGPFVVDRWGARSQIEQQLLSDDDPCFARVYGFSFEGYYYDLPKPVLFLVHGEGVPASQVRPGGFGNARAARAPGEPSLTGLGQADFQFSDDILVWSYDKADYTIRMDVETGMFEDVLLAAMLGGSGGLDSAGMNARGMNARGMNARGMNARGMNARGMNARGGGNSD